MNRIYSKNHKFKKMLANILSIFAILAIAFPATTFAHAATNSPFLGQWQATDVDGSDIRLTISGRPNGPFQITWTESYISFCNREAGIVRGTGQLNESNPNLLEAGLHLECFTTGEALEFHLVWRYHPATNTLSSSWNGVVTIWHRPGNPQAVPLALDLRINYGHDWVESFYEGGHTAWITVTESDGVTVKATAELVTEPKDYWNGETGFQSLDSVWSDADGNPMENPPDIQPYDWVFGWVDNGASAQVQIGDISGMIDLANDSIEGTIMASWFTVPVQVDCLDWGSGQEPPFDNKDGGPVLTNGEDPYSCSWYGEWDIQDYQNVGVGYLGPDGHWVANAFFARNPRIVASEAGDWFWTTEFNPGTLNLFIYESAEEGATLLWSGQSDADQSGFTIIGYDIHGQDMVPGNYLVVSDGMNEKGVVLERITMEVFDTENEIIAGTAPAGRDVMVVAGMAEAETQATMNLTADRESGAWVADFSTLPFDITEDMRPWSFAQIFDEDGDANEAGTPPPPPSPHFSVFPEWKYIEGWEWPDGATVYASIEEKSGCSAEGTAGYTEWDPITFVEMWFPAGCDAVVGDVVTLTDHVTTRQHTIQNLALTGVNAATDTVSGTADAGAQVHVWPHGYDELLPGTDANGNWTADFATVGIDLVGGMCGRSEIRDEVGNATAVDWCAPWSPRIVVQITDDWFRAENFSPNTSLNFWIYDAPGGNLLLNSTTESTDENGTVTRWVGDQVDLVPGNYVVVSDNVTTREIVLEALAFDMFDTSLGILRGAAPEPFGRTVSVGIGCWERDDLTMDITTNDNGDWIADFDAPVPNDFGCVYAQVFDAQGNASEVRPSRIFPMIFAWLEWDKVDGHGWREGETITLTIGDLVLTQVAGSSSITFDVGAAGHDLTVGELVQMSDGLITKQLQIPQMGITDYDLGANTISGFYDPSLGFRTSVFGQEVVDIAYDGNTWIVYFDDLKPLQWGDVVQRDADSDEVAATIRTPNPVFYVVPDEERIYAAEWSPGQSLVVSINGAAVASQLVPNHGSPYGSEVLFDLNGNYDLQAGQVVSLTDGRSTKELIVATLQVTGFDLGTHTIFGIAEPGPLFIGVNGEDKWITVGEEGTWEASSPNFDPLEWGSVIKTDDDSDQTRDIFMIPRPMMYAFADDNVVTGVVWTEGQPLTLQVYDSVSGDLAYERTEIVPPPSVVPWTVINFYLGGTGYDLKPGDRLVMSQNGYDRELILSSLQITGFDLSTRTMFGTGDTGAQFFVHINGEQVWGEVDSDGNWAISHPQLTAGVWGEAVQTDIDGDETRDGFQAPFE